MNANNFIFNTFVPIFMYFREIRILSKPPEKFVLKCPSKRKENLPCLFSIFVCSTISESILKIKERKNKKWQTHLSLICNIFFFKSNFSTKHDKKLFFVDDFLYFFFLFVFVLLFFLYFSIIICFLFYVLIEFLNPLLNLKICEFCFLFFYVAYILCRYFLFLYFSFDFVNFKSNRWFNKMFISLETTTTPSCAYNWIWSSHPI